MPDDERRGYHGDAKHRHFLRIRFYNETDGIFPGLEHILHGMCVHEVRTATVPSKWGFGSKGYKFKRTRYPCYENQQMGGRVVCILSPSLSLSLYAQAVIHVESKEEVMEAVAICAKYKIPIIPYGSGTSLEGHISAPYGGICIGTLVEPLSLSLSLSLSVCLYMPHNRSTHVCTCAR
eukprot:TRINITY_DN2512_c0_g1_i6.p1 TRINITY_DN2512_c0_g1~~TRINITY_DN2512_c0_g1_i6.p1  ORF type:complete len:178 (-),score=38.67 TRINITY_DN2512_c0_g1_i6:187-720(-)